MFKKKNRMDAVLVSQIKTVTIELAQANSTAAQCRDALLLESTIYQIKYLQTRYAYLTKLARERGISTPKYISKNGGKK